MSELGAGSGSSYPGGLDTNAAIEVNSPNPGKTKAKAEVINDLAAAIIAIETELGVDPAGSKATVVARLDTEHNADGSHKDTLIVTVSGHNQSISGRKIFASGIDTGIWGLNGTATVGIANRVAVSGIGGIFLGNNYVEGAGNLIWSGDNTFTGAASWAFAIAGNGNDATIADVDIPVTRAGILKNFYVKIMANTANTDSIFTIYKNGSSTAITLTVGAGQTGIFTNLINNFPVIVGDKLAVWFSRSSGTGSIRVRGFVIEFN